jgi:hypothetical protein
MSKKSDPNMISITFPCGHSVRTTDDYHLGDRVRVGYLSRSDPPRCHECRAPGPLLVDRFGTWCTISALDIHPTDVG